MSEFHRELLARNGFKTGLMGDFYTTENSTWKYISQDLESMQKLAVMDQGFEFDRLHDWDYADDPAPVGFVTSIDKHQIAVAFEDGVEIWLEKQNGQIRILCFDSVREEPVNIYTIKGSAHEAGNPRQAAG